jgi:hypothetical protein
VREVLKWTYRRAKCEVIISTREVLKCEVVISTSARICESVKVLPVQYALRVRVIRVIRVIRAAKRAALVQCCA